MVVLARFVDPESKIHVTFIDEDISILHVVNGHLCTTLIRQSILTLNGRRESMLQKRALLCMLKGRLLKTYWQHRSSLPSRSNLVDASCSMFQTSSVVQLMFLRRYIYCKGWVLFIESTRCGSSLHWRIFVLYSGFNSPGFAQIKIYGVFSWVRFNGAYRELLKICYCMFMGLRNSEWVWEFITHTWLNISLHKAIIEWW